MSLRVLLVDDHELLRIGLRAVFDNVEDIEVVGECRDGKQALADVAATRPDVVLMDIALPGVGGLEVTSQIKRRTPQTRVVLFTEFKTGEYLREALRVGADGYILKSTSLDQLLVALRSVGSGKKYISPDVADFVVDSFLHPEKTSNAHSLLETLTSRERTIMQLVAEGRTNRGVAEFLNVSPKTVEKHRGNLMHKLGLSSTAQLILVAMEIGFVQRPEPVSRLMDQTRNAPITVSVDSMV
ncbi:MAG: response regulator transcription factor [Betaproteobacteria bacterium]|nr:response regulator transcription factor [Betaproteobacteria bacterium]